MIYTEDSFHNGKAKTINRYEKDWLDYMAKVHGTNIAALCRIGKIDRTTMYRLMKKHGYTRWSLLRLSDPLAPRR